MRRIAFGLSLMIVVVAAGALAVAPARAQDDAALQPLVELSSVRFDYVSTFNGVPEIVCQEEWASGSRYHGTCRTFVTAQYPDVGIDRVAGRVIEYIYYDGVYYERENDATTWTSSRDEAYDPSLTINEILFRDYLSPSDTYVVSNLGRVDIGGTATTQYQFWSLDEDLNASSGGQYVYDVFVSDQGYVLKDHASMRGSFPKGAGELALIWTYAGFNAPVTIGTPPANAVRTSSAAPRGQSLPGALIAQR